MKLSQKFSLDCLPTIQKTESSFSDYIYSLYHTTILPIPDGNIHRFDIDKKGNKVGWYVMAEDKELQWGCCGDWRKGDRNTWSSKEILTDDQQLRIKAIANEADAKREQAHAIAADIAQMIYDTLPSASLDHPYLVRKQVGSDMFLKQSDDRLVLPVFDKDMKIRSLQFIDGSGKKHFLSGGETNGGFCFIGYSDTKISPGSQLFVAEGYATAKTIQQQTGKPCIVAFNAGNLPKVCKIFKDIYSLTIIADNDESETGERYAKQAEVPYILIPIKGMDANDYVNAGYSLMDLINPKPEQNKNNKWLCMADDFIENYSPSQWLIKKWIPARGLTMIYGAPSSGKTFVVIDMLLSICTAQQCWFRNRIHPGGVIYLCGEGYEGMRKRLKVWKQERGIGKIQDFAIAQSSLDLDKPQDLRFTVEQIQSIGFKPALIAIDTLNRFYSGDENDAQQIRGFLESCAELERIFDCAVMIIHHTGVSESAKERVRGSSALKGGVDTEILITKEEGYISLKQTKQKDDIPEELQVCLKGHVIEGWFDEDGEKVTSATVEELTRDDVLDKIAEDISLIQDAYMCSPGYKDEQGYPELHRNDLKDYLKNKLGYKDSAVKNALRNEPYRLIGKLLSAGIIRELQDGWSIVESSVVNVIALLQLGQKR